jgi:hypothetical protein
VRRLNPGTTQVDTLAGNPRANTPHQDGDGESAAFFRPIDLGLDGLGNLYVSDVSDHTLRKIAIAGRQVTTSAGHSVQEGVVLGALPGGLSNPVGVAVLSPGMGMVIAAPGERSLLRLQPF